MAGKNKVKVRMSEMAKREERWAWLLGMAVYCPSVYRLHVLHGLPDRLRDHRKYEPLDRY